MAHRKPFRPANRPFHPRIRNTESTPLERLLASNPIALHALSEAGAPLIESIHGIATTFSGGTPTYGVDGIGDGATAISTGSAVYVNYASTLNPYFNSSEGSMSGWIQAAAGQWTDGVDNRMVYLYADASNRIFFTKESSGLRFYTQRGGTANSLIVGIVKHTAWVNYTLTWSKSGNVIAAYLNGKRWLPTVADNGTFAGALAARQFAYKQSGAIALVALWDRALPEAEVQTMINPIAHMAFEGDSRTAGPDAKSWTHGVLGQIIGAAGCTKIVGGTNLAVSGSTVAAMAARAAAIDATRNLASTVLCVWAGVNDYAESAATIWANLSAYCAARRAAGWKVILCTEIDSSKANWTATTLPALNTLIRAGWSTCANALADLGADAKLQDCTDTTYYNADRVHLIEAGYDVVNGIVGPVATTFL